MGLALSIDIQTIIGIVYSGMAVGLAVFQVFVKGTHSRALDYIQWAYFLAITSAAVQFSDYLNVGSSLITLDSAVLTGFYCPLGVYVCTRPFSLSFIVVLTGIILIARLITIPQKVRQKGITFPRVYSLLKGFIKWVYTPLLIQSLTQLLSGSSQMIPAVVVLAVLVIFPIAQVILYKFFNPQTQDPNIKWLEFANYSKNKFFSLLIVLAVIYGSSAYYYYLALIILLHAGLFVYFNKFNYERVGKILYISACTQQAQHGLQTIRLIFFGLGIILLLDFIHITLQSRIVHTEWKNNKKTDILPEQSVHEQNKKKNRYNVDQMMDPNLGSKEDLNNQLANSSSIKKSNGRVKPK